MIWDCSRTHIHTHTHTHTTHKNTIQKERGERTGVYACMYAKIQKKNRHTHTKQHTHTHTKHTQHTQQHTHTNKTTINKPSLVAITKSFLLESVIAKPPLESLTVPL